MTAKDFLVLFYSVVNRLFVRVAQNDRELTLIEGLIIDYFGKVDVAFEFQDIAVGQLGQQRDHRGKPQSFYDVHSVVGVRRTAAELRQQSRQRFVQSELSVGVAGNIESQFELHVNRFKVVGSCVILRVEGGRQNRSRAVAVVQVYRQRIYRKSQGIIADFDRQSYRGGA